MNRGNSHKEKPHYSLGPHFKYAILNIQGGYLVSRTLWSFYLGNYNPVFHVMEFLLLHFHKYDICACGNNKICYSLVCAYRSQRKMLAILIHHSVAT